MHPQAPHIAWAWNEDLTDHVTGRGTEREQETIEIVDPDTGATHAPGLQCSPRVILRGAEAPLGLRRPRGRRRQREDASEALKGAEVAGTGDNANVVGCTPQVL